MLGCFPNLRVGFRWLPGRLCTVVEGNRSWTFTCHAYILAVRILNWKKKQPAKNRTKKVQLSRSAGNWIAFFQINIFRINLLAIFHHGEVFHHPMDSFPSTIRGASNRTTPRACRAKAKTELETSVPTIEVSCAALAPRKCTTIDEWFSKKKLRPCIKVPRC